MATSSIHNLPFLDNRPRWLKMPVQQALALALLTLDWEIENPQVEPPPDGWQTELFNARCTLRAVLFAIEPPAEPEPPIQRDTRGPMTTRGRGSR